MRIAINGFGRIGRTLLRVLNDVPEIEVVCIRDLADIHTMAHLLKYDSVHGRFPGEVSVSEDLLIAGHRSIRFVQTFASDSPDWQTLEVDVVVECTGTMKTLDQMQVHLSGGAGKVLLSAPPSGQEILMIVPGVNDHLMTGAERMLSCASCTTNSAAPMIHLLDKHWGISSCFITTVHSYTGDQRLHDAPHQDLRRARAAAESIVPTSTGAAKALYRIFPHLAENMGGCGIRVPVPDGSLTDITCTLHTTPTAAQINAVFQEASKETMKGILEYTEDPVVSVDVIGNPHSCLFDAQLTSVVGGMVKVVGWYDNEFGYSSRLVDVLRRM